MNYVKTAALLAILTALFLFLGNMLGGRQGAVIAFFFAVILNFGSYWFSDRIVLRMYKAKPVDKATAPELYAIVRELANRADIPMPKVYIMDNETPNAFATGRNPSHAAVAVTSGILKILTRDELCGVIGHELAHISNRDVLISTIAATFAGAISYLAQMAYFASLFGGRDNDRGSNPLVLIAMMIVAPIAAMVIQMAISRSREFAADRRGAEYSGNPLCLAAALGKLDHYGRKVPMRAVSDNVSKATAHLFIVSPLFGGGGMRKLFSTHPPVEERVRRLEAMV